MHEAYICMSVCVYIKHIIDDEVQACGKMLGNNSYSSYTCLDIVQMYEQQS